MGLYFFFHEATSLEDNNENIIQENLTKMNNKNSIHLD